MTKLTEMEVDRDSWKRIAERYMAECRRISESRDAETLRADRAEAALRNSVRGEQPFAWLTKTGLDQWLAGDGPENHVLLRTGNELRVAIYCEAGPLVATCGDLRRLRAALEAKSHDD